MNREKKMIRKNFIAAVSLSILMLAAGTIHAGQTQGDSSLFLSGGFISL